MIRIADKSQCCGCTACYSICPKDAITMVPDALGFLYPEVDTARCIDCGLCEKVCAFNENYDISPNLSVPDAYAARHKDISEVETSRSGAAFIAISDHILEKGGVVYGAGYEGHFRVVHKRAVTPAERDEFKGSKYVQSELGDTFRKIKSDLESGLSVLFSGTPCQTAGLSSYIGKKLRRNLYLVDIVCHGVPSPYIWRDYIAYLEKKRRKEIVWVNFRDKQAFGWRAHKETFRFRGDGNRNSIFSYTYYTHIFYKHILFRKSCGLCPYANVRRPSDITIADFWGWERTDPTFNNDNKGVSLVLVNTLKGKSLFEAAKTDLNIVPARLEDCLQPNLVQSSAEHPNRDDFERDYALKGFLYVMKKYGDMGWRYRIYKQICGLKNVIKRLFR